jgi:3-phosphoshikimate 1-carboxyvinyltransferase
MTAQIHPSGIDGAVTAPSSKSHAQRAIAASLLASGTSTLHNLTLCADTTAALNAVQTLGAEISCNHHNSYNSYNACNESVYNITSHFCERSIAPQTISCGESGLLARMIAPIAALCGQPMTICGEGSLLKRPIAGIVAALRQFGVQADSNNGCLPLSLRPMQGRLRGNSAHIDGSDGSQTLTGLLMALPLAQEDSTIYVTHLKSVPYIALTIDVLKQFGITIEHTNYQTFIIHGGQRYSPCACTIEGDWSAASCLLVAGCIAGRVSVCGLNLHSRQADIAILDAIKLAGGVVAIEGNVVTAHKSAVSAFNFDASDCPDLFPALVALAAYAQGTSCISGAQRLLHKESNRGLTLQQEYAKVGIGIDLRGDNMYIKGGAIGGGNVFAHNDHRIAMSLAAAALGATGTITIEQSECVDKSYPQFWEHFYALRPYHVAHINNRAGDVDVR